MEFKRRRELKRTKIEIIPMIDTMFFLLVFFMLSSLALTRLNGLPVNLPRASTAPIVPCPTTQAGCRPSRTPWCTSRPGSWKPRSTATWCR